MSTRSIKLLAAALSLPVLAVSCGGSDGLRADAGPDLSVKVGDPPTFDGCRSSGEITNYAWVIVAAPGDMASDIGKPIREAEAGCSFDMEASMVVDEAGTWVIELTVTDTDGNSSKDTVSVEVVQ